jgi:hypothetical protein
VRDCPGRSDCALVDVGVDVYEDLGEGRGEAGGTEPGGLPLWADDRVDDLPAALPRYVFGELIEAQVVSPPSSYARFR